MKTLLKTVAPLIVLALFVLPAMHMLKSRPDPQRRPPPVTHSTVEAKRVTPENFAIRIPTQGTIQPRIESRLTSQVAGSITQIADNLRNGAFITAGEVLVEIDKRDYEHARARAQASLAQAEQTIIERRISMRRAETDIIVSESDVVQADLSVVEENARAEQAIQDWKRLGRDGEPSDLVLRKPQLAAADSAKQAAEARLMQKHLDLQLATTKIETATAAEAIVRAELAQRKLDLERTTIVAPFDGRIVGRNVDLGQVVTTNTELATLYAVDFAEVRLPLHSRQLGFVNLPARPDDEPVPVDLYFMVGHREHHRRARIVRTDAQVDTRSRQLFAIAQLPDPFARADSTKTPLPIGTFVRAEIRGQTLEQVFVLPRKAVREETQVLVATEDGKLFRRTITPLWSDQDVVVTREGFTAGELLCITAVGVVSDGMEVGLQIEGEAAKPPPSGPPKGPKGGGKGKRPQP